MKAIRKAFGMTVLSGALLAVTAGSSYAGAAEDAAGTTAPSCGLQDHEPHGWSHDPGYGHGYGHLFNKLNLSDEQRASMKAVMTAAKPQMSALRQQMTANHLKLMRSDPNDANYPSIVAEVAQSNATLASKRTTEGAELKTQLVALLTPAQKIQLVTLEGQLPSVE